MAQPLENVQLESKRTILEQVSSGCGSWRHRLPWLVTFGDVWWCLVIFGGRKVHRLEDLEVPVSTGGGKKSFIAQIEMRTLLYNYKLHFEYVIYIYMYIFISLLSIISYIYCIYAYHIQLPLPLAFVHPFVALRTTCYALAERRGLPLAADLQIRHLGDSQRAVRCQRWAPAHGWDDGPTLYIGIGYIYIWYMIYDKNIYIYMYSDSSLDLLRL